jgi:hypothetical protein
VGQRAPSHSPPSWIAIAPSNSASDGSRRSHAINTIDIPIAYST